MTSAAVILQDRIQTLLGDRCEAAFLRPQPVEETIPSPAGGVPRGALTEITGPVSSGRTSLLYSLLAEVSSQQECCALLDAGNAFDPVRAAAAGVRLQRLLWVRCNGNAEHAMKAADLLIQGGGFGLVAIDFADTPIKTVHRVPLASWFRLRHAVQNTRTAVIVLAQQAHTQSSAALRVSFCAARPLWRGRWPGCILDGFEALAQRLRNHGSQERGFRIAV